MGSSARKVSKLTAHLNSHSVPGFPKMKLGSHPSQPLGTILHEVINHVARRRDPLRRLQSSLSFMQAANSVVVSAPASLLRTPT